MTQPDHEADQAAMERLRAGDDLALNELMSRWQDPIVRFLLRYTGSEPDALDLAQDAFVRVYEARLRYDARGKFSTWLYTIAENLCRNHARYKSRHPALSLDATLTEDGEETLADHLPGAGVGPSQEAGDREITAAVRDAIHELPEEQRTATILFEYQDLSHAEIATVLGCSSKAVETRLYRARQTLREKLSRWLK